MGKIALHVIEARYAGILSKPSSKVCVSLWLKAILFFVNSSEAGEREIPTYDE
jgi:hypothetical protein